jgi:nicotinamide-nucleotide amidase
MTAEKLVRVLMERGFKVTTAESCTGGLVAAAITDIAGASAVFDRGFVTYSNAAKHTLLGVPEDMLEAHGAVSEPVARAMAEGALRVSMADISVAVTGIAGPSGGSPGKPVGLVHFACSTHDVTVHRRVVFQQSTRPGIRAAAVDQAICLMLDCL